MEAEYLEIMGQSARVAFKPSAPFVFDDALPATEEEARETWGTSPSAQSGQEEMLAMLGADE